MKIKKKNLDTIIWGMSIPSKISTKTNPNRIDGIARIGEFMYPLFTTYLKTYLFTTYLFFIFIYHIFIDLQLRFKTHEPFSYFVSLQSPCSSSPCQHEATCCDDKFSPQNWKTESSRTEQQQLGEITL